MAKPSKFQPAELREDINQFNDDGTLVLNRSVLQETEADDTKVYERQYITYTNLPALTGLEKRAFIEGMKVLSKGYYKDENWSELGKISYGQASPTIEAHFIASQDSSGSAYQDALKVTLSAFDTYCNKRAKEKGKEVRIYAAYKAAVRAKTKVLELSPKALERLRMLWSDFVDQCDDPEARTVVNTTQLIHFDRVEVEDDDDI